MPQDETRTFQDIIDNLQKQIDDLRSKNVVVYPGKPGDHVLLPADDTGKRLIKIIPSGEAAVANLFSILGVEVYEGEVPACGYIIDNRKHKAYSAPVEKAENPNEPPKDFKTNTPKELNEKEQVAAVAAAILALNKDDFTVGTGYPKVASLSKIVGFDVQTAIRDAAWETFKKSQPNGEPEEEPAKA
jgi:hypothetical protein